MTGGHDSNGTASRETVWVKARGRICSYAIHLAVAVMNGMDYLSLGHYPDVPEGGVIWVFAVK